MNNSTRPDHDERTRFKRESGAEFNEALRLRDSGELERAIEILRKIARKHPSIAATFGVLGGIYRDLERNVDAIECLQIAISINPNSELANRSLFHALWELGRKDEAANVLRRYLAVSESEEFRRILIGIEAGQESGFEKCRDEGDSDAS